MKKPEINLRSWAIAVFLVVALFIQGCSPRPEEPSQSTAPATATSSPAAQAPATDDPFANLPRLEGEATVELVVKGSPITIQVDGTNAPVTAGNFVDLVQRGVYNGLMFHRVVREPQPFVVQGGDPQSADPNIPVTQLGTGGFVDPATSTTRYIPLEIKPEEAEAPLYSQTFQEAGITVPPVLPHSRGAVAMARSQFPDSASSQFYIALQGLAALDGNYAVFGNVTSGMEVVDQIQQGDRIDSARVVSGLENLRVPGQ